MWDYCMFCEHNTGYVDKGDVKISTCKAFPNGIPDKYRMFSGDTQIIEENGKLVKTKLHNKVVKGQIGDYVFKRS